MSCEYFIFDDGPKRVGPFSHAVKAGQFLFVTGQMPTLPQDPKKIVSNDEEQTHQVMKNLLNVLNKSKVSWENIVFVRMYLVNFQDFDKVNKVYETYFSKINCLQEHVLVSLV